MVRVPPSIATTCVGNSDTHRAPFFLQKEVKTLYVHKIFHEKKLNLLMEIPPENLRYGAQANHVNEYIQFKITHA